MFLDFQPDITIETKIIAIYISIIMVVIILIRFNVLFLIVRNMLRLKEKSLKKNNILVDNKIKMIVKHILSNICLKFV